MQSPPPLHLPLLNFSRPGGLWKISGLLTILGCISLISHGSPPSLAWSFSGKPPLPRSYVRLEPLTKVTFSQPVFITPSPDTSQRLFVVEQEGLIHILNAGVKTGVFLDISHKLSTGGERGLLGLAFHPQFSSNGRFFVNYTREVDRATVIAEYHVSPNPNKARPKERVLLVIPQPYGNHNGGMIAFGPDGFLYIGLGDGGSGGDPENRAQNPHALLGKFLRIDINKPTNHLPYDIPADNPFVGEKGRPEIFALGLRNPWRFSFDRESGELWAGDVGQNDWEEINVIKKGKNYGWRLLEGSHCYNPSKDCRPNFQVQDPVTEYEHIKGRCSVTGGYVYRGSRIPKLKGAYVFGDFCSGEIWGYRDGRTQLLLETDVHISSFGEDLDGELHVVGYEGNLYKLEPRVVHPAPKAPSPGSYD